ncbi:MAG TPA: hypothetical protein VG847_08230 [Chitinophagaceae bacterium]|nr:hypothetical protein [Chitinophagaceae bacterium]
MKKIFIIRIAAVALFCLGTLAIKSESPCKRISACANIKCNKRDSSQCEKKTIVQNQKKTAESSNAKTPERVTNPVSPASDLGHDAFFIKI